MNQLTCEMCGSTDLLKQDGVFVCQTCGCKYSVEEAKKMMIEGTVDVSGSTIKIDRSSEIDNRLKNIEGEYNAHHMTECFRLCSDLLNIDPENVTAIIYKALADGWTSSVANSKLSTTKYELERAVKLSARKAENSLDYMMACTLVVDGFSQICESMIDAYMNSFSRELEDINRQIDRAKNQMQHAHDMDWQLADYSIKLLNESKAMVDDAVRKQSTGIQKLVQQVESVLVIYINMIDIIIDEIKPDWLILDIFMDMVCQCARTFDTSVVEMGKNDISISAEIKSQIHNLPNNIRKVQANHKEFLRKKKVEKYWNEHPEEKNQIDNEIAEINRQLEDLEKEINPLKAQKSQLESEFSKKKNELQRLQNERLPIDDDIDRLNNQITMLNSNLNSLGIFKGKEKKALRDEIEALQRRLSETKQQSQVEHSRHSDEIRMQICQVSDEYNSQIQSLGPQMAVFNSKTNELIGKRNELQQKLDNIE